MRTCKLLLAPCVGILASMALLCGSASADDRRGSHVVLGQNAGTASYPATITTNGRGVWIDVHSRQTYGGQYSVPSSASASYVSYGT